MNAVIGPIVSLLLATAILLAGNGLQGTLIAVRANIEAFPIEVIGLLMSAYYAGFVAGCFVNPIFVKQVGHIRTFAALASIASAAALLHALVVEPVTWLLLRCLVGFCFAGLSMVTESWINEKATNKNRGRILSVYRLVDLIGVTLGQVLLTLADPAGFTLFCLISVLISCALVPVTLTTAVAPRPIKSGRINISKLTDASPLAAWGVSTTGLSNGAFWGLAPVFVQNVGFGFEGVALFMSVTILGGAISQYPVGLLSDKLDRRHVLVAIAGLSAAASFGLIYVVPYGLNLTLVAAFVYGAFAMCHYSMAVAHANDRARNEDFVELSSSLLFLFGVGAAIGPVLAAVAIDYFGDNMLFIYMAAIQFLMFVFGIYRIIKEPGVPRDKQESFVAVPDTTPQIIELDPRSDLDLDPGATETASRDENSI